MDNQIRTNQNLNFEPDLFPSIRFCIHDYKKLDDQIFGKAMPGLMHKQMQLVAQVEQCPVLWAPLAPLWTP